MMHLIFVPQIRYNNGKFACEDTKMTTENNIIELRHVKKCYEKDTPVIKDFPYDKKRGICYLFGTVRLRKNDDIAYDWRL